MKKFIISLLLLVFPIIAFAKGDNSEQGENLVEIRGVVEQQWTSWCPEFNECTTACHFIRHLDKTYYLAGICPFLELYFPLNYELSGCEIVIKGMVEHRGVDVPMRKELNPPTCHKTYSVINVQDMQVVAPVKIYLPRDLRALYIKGRSAYKKAHEGNKDFSEAEKYFLDFFEGIDENNTEMKRSLLAAYLNLCLIYRESGREKDEEKIKNKIFILFPDKKAELERYTVFPSIKVNPR